MPLFLGVHRFGKTMRPQDVKAAWRTYRKSCRDMRLKALSLTYSLDEGVGYCLTKAPSKGHVRRAHRKVKVPLKQILEVKKM